MLFAAPLAGLFGLTLAAIAALYVLKVRRPDVTLPSTLLWRRAVRDREASVPWQRPRPTWLLVLQLLAAAVLVLALVQPFIVRADHLGGHTVVVVDVGATMQATDVAPSRLESARSQVRDLLDLMGPSDRVTLIAMGSRARVLADATGDAGRLRSALDGLRAENGTADLEGALQLSAGVATSAQSRLLLYSDGVTEPLRQPTTLPFEVEYHSIGASGEDIAVSSLTVEGGPPTKVAVAHVQNNGREHHHADLEWRVDGALRDARALELDPGAGVDVTLSLDDAATIVEARLTGSDVLALDDRAVAVARTPRTFSVELVTRQNVFLQRVLGLRPDLKVHVVDPDRYALDQSADLVVLDGFLPPSLPDRPLLITAPPADPRIGTAGYTTAGRLRATAPGEPLLSGVDLSDVSVARTRALTPPAPFRSLLAGDSGPLVTVRDSAPRAAVFGFDLHESNLPLRAAFPILMDRIDGYLVPAAVPPRSHEPGESIAVSAPSAQSAVSITKPDGATVDLPAGGGVLGAEDTQQTGVYTVAVTTGQSTERSLFAVDAFDLGRSSPAPRPKPALSGSATTLPGPNKGGGSPLEFWPYLAVAAAAVLSLEWWAYHRGI